MNPELPIDPRDASEARLTAWLLGELSEAEAAEVRQAIAADPELARLHQRLQHTIGLVREASAPPAGNVSLPPVPLRLSEARRQRLQQQFQTNPAAARRRGAWRVPLTIAAMLIALVGLTALLLLPQAVHERRAYTAAVGVRAPAKGATVEGLATLERLRSAGYPTHKDGADLGELALTESRRKELKQDGSGISFGFGGMGGGQSQSGLTADRGATKEGRELTAGRFTYNANASAPADAAYTQPMTPPPAPPAPTTAPAPAAPNASTPAVTTSRGFSAGGGAGARFGGRLPIQLPMPTLKGTPDELPTGANIEPIQETMRQSASWLRAGNADQNSLAPAGQAGNPAQLGGEQAFETERPMVAGNSFFKNGVQDRLAPAEQPAGDRADDKTTGVFRFDVIGDSRGDNRHWPEKKTEVLSRGNAVVPSADSSDRSDAADKKDNVSERYIVGGALKPIDPAGKVYSVDVLGLTTNRLSDTAGLNLVAGDHAEKRRWDFQLDGNLHAFDAESRPASAASSGSVRAGSLSLEETDARQEAQVQLRVESESLVAGLEKQKKLSTVADQPAGAEDASSLALGNALVLRGRVQTQIELPGKTESAARPGVVSGPEPAMARAAEVSRRLSEAKPSTSTRRPAPTAVAEKPAAPAATPAAPVVASDEDSVQRQRSAAAPVPQPEVATRANAFSTFSLNVSDVAFKLAAASLGQGAMPDPSIMRSEEFINAFQYRDPEPAPGQAVGFNWDRARSPFAHNRDLLRFAVRTAARGREPGRPLNLVLLLDNSGSMERADRVRIVQECLVVLARQLKAQDKVSVVTFARTARLWADGVAGTQAAEVFARVGTLTPQGGTNLEDAMELAYQTARKHYLVQGINRVVLLTDGAANLGNVDPDALKQKVEAQRRQGVALDCFGIGWEGYNDDLLEVLSRNGDGRYGFVNTPEEAAGEFAGQLAGALQVAASDVKVQVEFNPRRTLAYRQVGYAKHQLRKEQFRDNTVDAAEIGAAESGNALYVVHLNPAGEGPIGVVRVRYRVPGTDQYREHEWSVPYTGPAPALEQAGPAMRLAASAAAFSEWLAGSPYAADVTPDRLLGLLRGVPDVYGADPRPRQLESMVRQAQALAGTVKR